MVHKVPSSRTISRDDASRDVCGPRLNLRRAHSISPPATATEAAMADTPDDTPPESKLTRTKQEWARSAVSDGAAGASRKRPPAAGPASRQELAGPRPRPSAGRLGRALAACRSTARWKIRRSGTGPVSRPAADRGDHRHALRDHLVALRQSLGGRSTRDLMAAVRPREDAAFVVLGSYDGYTTNLPLSDFAAPMRCWSIRGRGVRSRRSTAARCGCWCRISTSGRAPNGCARSSSAPRTSRLLGGARYHNRGDPWTEERYSD